MAETRDVDETLRWCGFAVVGFRMGEGRSDMSADASSSESGSESRIFSWDKGCGCFDCVVAFGRADDCNFLEGPTLVVVVVVAAFRRRRSDCSWLRPCELDLVPMGPNWGVFEEMGWPPVFEGLDRPLMGVRPPGMGVLLDCFSAASFASSRKFL